MACWNDIIAFFTVQELRESGVLSEEEFEEQKTFALQNIRGLNKSI